MRVIAQFKQRQSYLQVVVAIVVGSPRCWMTAIEHRGYGPTLS